MIHQKPTTVRLISANQSAAQFLIHKNELHIMKSHFVKDLLECYFGNGRVNSRQSVQQVKCSQQDSCFLKKWCCCALCVVLGRFLGNPALWLTTCSSCAFCFHHSVWLVWSSCWVSSWHEIQPHGMSFLAGMENDYSGCCGNRGFF